MLNALLVHTKTHFLIASNEFNVSVATASNTDGKFLKTFVVCVICAPFSAIVIFYFSHEIVPRSKLSI